MKVKKPLLSKRGESIMEAIVSLLILSILMTTLVSILRFSMAMTTSAISDASEAQIEFNALKINPAGTPVPPLIFTADLNHPDVLEPPIKINAEHLVSLNIDVPNTVAFNPPPPTP